MSARLPGTKYKTVFDRGRSVKGRLLVAWHYSAPDADQQAGVVVSKKSFRHAVDRNRAKRLLREAYRLLVKDGLAPADTSWVFIGRSSMKGRSCGEIEGEMRRVMRKASNG
jgi:ribonuclease P protein component